MGESICRVGAIPWVSFLGYSIRHDGSTRLRKETLLAHVKSIQEECETFTLQAEKFGFRNPHDKYKAVGDFLCRLITKGTGRINIEPIKGLGRCWIAVFRFVGESKSGLKQMKYLDYIRSSAIAKLLRRFHMRQLNIKNNRPSGGNLKPCLYIGKPFSYYGSCEKLNRKSIANDRCFSLYECITPQDVGVSDVSTIEPLEDLECVDADMCPEHDDVERALGAEECLHNASEAKDAPSDSEEIDDLDIYDEEWETSGWERARGFGR